MINGLWGKKLGMAQIFAEDKTVVPVTVVDAAHWFVTNVKTKERDGYDAIQVSYVRPRYQGQAFDKQWLKASKKYFAHIYEVRLKDAVEDLEVGQKMPYADVFAVGDFVDVAGVSKGRGFAGVIKRHGFSGGGRTHGSNLHRSTGSISFMATQGRVIKGKKMPGHMGAERCTVKNLQVVSVDQKKDIFLIRGAVPGSPGTPLFVRKVGQGNG